MASSFNYTISTDTLNGAVATAKLKNEISAAAINIALSSVGQTQDNLDIVFKANLSVGEETTLDGVVSAHDGVELKEDRVQKTQKILGEDKVTVIFPGYSFTALKNTSTTKDVPINFKYIRSLRVECEKNVLFDNIKVEIVDKVPSPDVVKRTYADGYQISKTGIDHFVGDSRSKSIPSGLHLRIIYTSTGTVDDVKVSVNAETYNDA